MTTAAETFVDTNVLLAATSPTRKGHDAALALMTRAERLALSGQVIREYLVVATRPVAANGLGLQPADALDNAREFLGRVRFLPETTAVRDALFEILTSAPCVGKIIHDTNIVATMRAHGIRRLATLNPGDFERFDTWVDLVGLEPANCE